MNTFYYIDNLEIKSVTTVKDKDYMTNFLKKQMYDCVNDILIPNGYEIVNNILEPTFETIYNTKYLEIKNAFNNYELNGIEGGIDSATLGIKIQCAKSDIEKIQAIVNAQTLGVAIPTYYKGISEIVSDITPEDFQNVYKELYTVYMSQWEIKQTKYLQLKAATTKEEIEAI